MTRPPSQAARSSSRTWSTARCGRPSGPADEPGCDAARRRPSRLRRRALATTLTQEAGDDRLTVDLEHGCRLASLRVHGHELLVTSAPGPIDWGCFPMAPYAGRVRDGRFAFRGRSYDLPRTLGGHAIHGSAYLRRWEAESDTAFGADLDPGWPFPGRVRQEIELAAGEVRLRLEVHAERGAMPASCGWHPWFRRVIAGAQAALDFRPGFAFARDAGGVATRTRCPVPEPPWDDCFGEVEGNPAITWPGVLRLELEADCRFWVVFTARAHSLCIEPQTAPPDALNHDPFVVEPGHPLTAECTLRWRLPESGARAAGSPTG